MHSVESVPVALNLALIKFMLLPWMADSDCVEHSDNLDGPTSPKKQRNNQRAAVYCTTFNPAWKQN